MKPELIVMLTNNDRTVENALDIFEECKSIPLNTWGFKDVGVSREKMLALAKAMKDAGKTVYIENIERDEDKILACADLCIECGVDYMSGGKYYASARDKLHEAGLGYEPTLGHLIGRPAYLDGKIEDIAAEATSLLSENIEGVGLASYRYDGDPVALMKAVSATGVHLCIAGSIDSLDRLDEVIECGASSFTIGSAFFAHKFGDSFYEQLTAVYEHLQRYAE